MLRTADDEALARAAVAGDGAAFAQLYDRHERRAFNLAYRITGTREDAADATQDAFVKLLARLPRMTGRKLDFGSYLLTAVRHSSYDVLAAARRADPTGDVPDSARPVGAAAAPPPEEDPGRRVLLAAQQEEIRAANATLPPRQREVLALRELEGLSYDEIAAQMGMNRNSVAQLISRARIGLRDALRRTALASIAPATTDCERALGLVAMRDDGELGADAWLDAHLTGCETCAPARAAMAEAGASYRAWAPIGVLEALRRDTIAKAGERLGHDWSTLVPRTVGRSLRPLRRRLRRDVLVAVGAAVLVLLALLSSRTQDGVVAADPETPATAAPAVPVQHAETTPAVVTAAPARRATQATAPVAEPLVTRPVASSSVAVKRPPPPARQAPQSRSAPAAAGPPPVVAAPVVAAPVVVAPVVAAPVVAAPVVAAPVVVEAPVAEDVDVTPPQPPPPPPPRPLVTNFVTPPPPPPTRPRRIVPRGSTTGGSSGVPVP